MPAKKFSLDPHVSRLFDLSPDAIFIDSGGVVVYANAAGARLFGAPDAAALCGLRGEKLRDPSTAEAADERIGRLIAQPGSAMPFVERRYRRLDGSTVDVEVAAYSYAEAGGVHIVVTARDATERKRAAQALAQSEARFHDFAAASGEWFWETDAEGRYTWFSQEVERITGFAREWHYGKNRLELATAAGVDLAAEPWRSHVAALERHEPFRDFRYLRRAPDGLRWVRSSGVPVFGAGGVFLGYRGTGVDISAQVEVEQKMRALLDGIPDRAWLKDADGRYTAINRSEEEAHGIPAAGIIGRRAAELIPAEEARGVEEEDRAAMAAPGPLRFERKSNLGDGWREIIKAPIRTDQGTVAGLVAISRDVTERKRAEGELERARERLQRALEGSNLSLWDTDLRTGEVYLSESWAELIGNQRGETRTTVDALARIVHPDDIAELTRLSAEVVKGLRQEYVEAHRVRTAAGEWKWIHSTGKVSERDASGRALRMTGTNRDITAAKIAEIALRASEARFRSLTDLSSDWYWEQDDQFRFTFMSGLLRERTGIEIQEHLGKTRWDMPALNLAGEDWRLHKELLERHEPFADFVMHRPDRDGRPHWVSVSGEPIFDEKGRFGGYRGIGRDVTEIHVARERIEGLNAELEERVRARTAELEALVKELETFQYAVAHDLHTSLGVMSVNAGMLLTDLGPQLDEKHLQALGRLEENAQLTAQLLDDLLAYSRLGRETVQRTPVSMQGLVQESWRKIARGAADRAFRFDARSLPECAGDTRMLAQLWARLLSNAAKFTRTREAARVEVGYERDAYFVRDNGVGFDMRHAERLFGVFERLPHDERFEGTGVGLAIAARIVRRHGGRIWAQARPGEGATFYFTIP